MINVYSPTIQTICGSPPGSLPTQVDFMNPPVPSGQGDFSPALQTMPPQQMAYNYGPVVGQPMSYQQQRDFAAQQLQQELYNPMTPTVQVGGYGGTPQYYNPFVAQQQNGGIFQQQQQQTSKVVQGFNPLGAETIQSSDYSQRKQEIEEFYQEAARQDMDQRYAQYQNTWNYYGNMNTSFVDSTIVNAYANAKQNLESEAKENRIEMNKALSKLAHTYNGDPISDEELAQIYEDKVMPAPLGYTMYDQAQAQQMAKLQPYNDNYQQIVAKKQAEVSAKYGAFVKQDADLYEFLDSAGMILWDQWQQEGQLRQRNRNTFGDGEFRQFIGSQIQRREPNNANAFQALMETFPDGINEIANGGMPDGMELLDDNTIKINYPVKKEVVNEAENDYLKQRYAFTNAIYNKGVVD